MNLVVELPRSDGSGACRRYRAIAKLGGGTFGDILAAVNEADPEDWTALKIEGCYRAHDTERRRTEASMVRFERLVCRELAEGASPGDATCPIIWGSCCVAGEHEVLAMELLGPNLRDYATELGRWPLPEDTVLALGAALVGRLEQLHARGFVHRDLKPENLLLRLERGEREWSVPSLLLVDYALAMRFAGPGGAGHIAERRDANTAGTFRYMAVHAQQGVTQSRRSDLESLAHVLLYLALGQLPWQQDQDAAMLKKKEQLPIDELCRTVRPAFGQFLKQCRALGFDEQPRYESLQRGLLQGIQGQVSLKAAHVRHNFRKRLQEAYLKHEAACAVAQLSLRSRMPTVQGPPLPALTVFARHDAKRDTSELLPLELLPASGAVVDSRAFFFEGYRDPLPGTVHVIAGSRHFFGFLKEEYLLQALQEELAQATPPGSTEQPQVELVLVFSLGRRDWVARAALLRDYDPSTGRPHREWNLRSAFWSRVTLPA